MEDWNDGNCTFYEKTGIASTASCLKSYPPKPETETSKYFQMYHDYFSDEDCTFISFKPKLYDQIFSACEK